MRRPTRASGRADSNSQLIELTGHFGQTHPSWSVLERESPLPIGKAGPRRSGSASSDEFKNGQSQAVRLPREIALPGKGVHVRRVGRGVLLVPKEDLWAAVSAALDLFTDDFMAQRAQPTQDERAPP